MAIRIMITDDHSMIREGLKNLLELDGEIEVIAEAENGEECLKKLETITPDVLLLDINMPHMDGYETVRAIRKSQKTDAHTVPVFAMTANAFSEDVAEAMNAGMDGHIAKPIEIHILYETLQEVFKSHEQI